MITSFGTNSYGSFMLDTLGRRNVSNTTWSKETIQVSTWVKEGFNWWNGITTESIEDLLTEGDDVLLLETSSSLVWDKETIGSSTWIKE
ncbi:MAG: hypothetical protein N3D20_02775 [Candidatus Pacearchaeota archaeon]|nr:hypothetical protein [Candidatus Pacearchaeota archaeon]